MFKARGARLLCAAIPPRSARPRGLPKGADCAEGAARKNGTPRKAPRPFHACAPLSPPVRGAATPPGYNRSMMALAGISPVAAADTMLPATPGPSPATYSPFSEVSRWLSVSTWVAKNLISGA